MVIISDTTTLSNLLAIGKTHLLQQLFHEITVPPIVQQELVAFEALRPSVENLFAEGWVHVATPTDPDTLRALRLILDGGEAEAIALAVERQADLLIMDEQAGRREAARRGLRIIGLLGILVEAKREGLIDRVSDTLNELILKAGFWVNPRLKREVLESVGE